MFVAVNQRGRAGARARTRGATCFRSGRSRVITLVGDTEIAFDDIGSGLPVVFLHAFPLNRTMWEPQIGALVAECRCIPIDFRGFGDSRASPPYTDGSLRRRRRRGARHAADRARRGRRTLDGRIRRVRALAPPPRARSRPRARRHARRRRHERGHRAAPRVDRDRRDAGQRRRWRTCRSPVSSERSTRDKRPDIYDAMHRMMAQAPRRGHRRRRSRR